MREIPVPPAIPPLPAPPEEFTVVRSDREGYHTVGCASSRGGQTLAVPAVVLGDVIGTVWSGRRSACPCVQTVVRAARAYVNLVERLAASDHSLARLARVSGKDVPKACAALERDVASAQAMLADAQHLAEDGRLQEIRDWLVQAARYARARQDAWTASLVVTLEIVNAHLRRLPDQQLLERAALWQPLRDELSTAIDDGMDPLIAASGQRSASSNYGYRVSAEFVRAAVLGNAKPALSNLAHPWLRPLHGSFTQRATWTPSMRADAQQVLDAAWNLACATVAAYQAEPASLDRWCVLRVREAIARDIVAAYPHARMPSGELLLSAPTAVAYALLRRTTVGQIVCEGRHSARVLIDACAIGGENLAGAIESAEILRANP